MAGWFERPIKGISCALWDSQAAVFLARMGSPSSDRLSPAEQFKLLAERLASLGFNTVFLHCFQDHGELRDERAIAEICQALRDRDIAPVCYGPGLILRKNPGYRTAVNRLGEANDPGLICPNEEGYVTRLVEAGRKLASLGAGGVMQDMLRYEKNDNRFPPVEYCFCDTCLGKFQRESGTTIPAKYRTTREKADFVLGLLEPFDHRVFIAWRARQITSIASRMAQATHFDFPQCMVGNFAYVGPHNQNMYRVGHDLEGLARAFSEEGRYPVILGPMGYGMAPYDLLFRARWYRDQIKGMAKSVWALTPLMTTLEELALQIKMARLGGADGFFLWALRFLHPEHYRKWDIIQRAMDQMDRIPAVFEEVP